MKTIIKTEKAPKAIGPYSQAIKSGNFIFISGQLPIEPISGLIPQDIKEQTKNVLNNIKAILEEANCNMENIVKTTVYITDLSLFQEMNEIYGQFFKNAPPARATVEVKALPKGAKIEIEAIAIDKNL